MKITFRVYDSTGLWLRSLDAPSRAEAWANLQLRENRQDQTRREAQDALRAIGYTVRRHVHTNELEKTIATEVANETIGPRKAAALWGLGKLIKSVLFGKGKQQ
jgi:hypothetical protein